MRWILLSFIVAFLSFALRLGAPDPTQASKSGADNTKKEPERAQQSRPGVRSIVPGPEAFESEAELSHWAGSSSFGGGRALPFEYHGRRLMVVFRCHTSGIASSEPFLFLEDKGKWIRLLHAMTCYFEMEASIQDDELTLWHLEWPKGTRTRTAFLKYNLADLPNIGRGFRPLK